MTFETDSPDEMQDQREAQARLTKDRRITELERSLGERTQEREALAANLSMAEEEFREETFRLYEVIKAHVSPEEWKRMDLDAPLAARDAAQRKAGAIEALRKVLREIGTTAWKSDSERADWWLWKIASQIERGEVQP